MKLRSAALALIMTGSLVAGCSEEEPQEFSDDNRSGFLAACIDPLEDTLLTSSICQCVYDESLVQVPFTRFAAIERELRDEEGDHELPEELVEIVVQCVIEEAEL